MKNTLHKATSILNFENAKLLRKNATEAEAVLWEMLRSKKFHNCKFRRQHPLQSYIADFYCHELKLVIELDGGYHGTEEQKLLDQQRTDILNESGITVIRLKNEELLNNINGSLEKISQIINDLKSPSPLGEGRGEVL